MVNAELSDICEVRTVKSEPEANKLLGQGFRLIKIEDKLKINWGDGIYLDPFVVEYKEYTLGKPLLN